MRQSYNCILCEIEGIKKRGTHLVEENTVDGKAYLCDKHFNEWELLQELAKENYADPNTED